MDGSHPRSEIWSYKQKTQSIKRVYETHGKNNVSLLAVDDGKLYFSILNQIWTSDGDTAIKLIEYNYYSSYIYGSQELQIDDKQFIVMRDDAHGTELWLRQNGSEKMIKDINPGVNASYPSFFTQYGNYLVFTANKDNHGKPAYTFYITIIFCFDPY